MSELQKCCVCHKANADGYACHDCTDEARKHLHSIAYLAFHVDDKRAKVRAIDYRSAGVRTREVPLPYDPRVSRVVDPIVTALIGTHAIIAENARSIDLAVDVDNLADLATWIAEHVDHLRTIPEGPEEFGTFETCAKNLDILFDRPPDQLYLGTCGAELEDHACAEAVYVENKRPLPAEAECRRCGAGVVVTERRETFRDQVKAYQATMRELVKLAPLYLEDGVGHRTLQEWTRHGILLAVGERVVQDLSGRWQRVPTYRIGDLGPARVAWEQMREDRKARRTRESMAG